MVPLSPAIGTTDHEQGNRLLSAELARHRLPRAIAARVRAATTMRCCKPAANLTRDLNVAQRR